MEAWEIGHQIKKYRQKNEMSIRRFAEHDIEEIAYVLEGEVEISFERDTFTLYEGDTVRILPKRKHLFRNRSALMTKVLFVMSK